MKRLRERQDRRRETEKMRNYAEGGSPLSKTSTASRSPPEKRGRRRQKK
jgi:hypothetical protein